MNEQCANLYHCTGGGYIIRSATGKRDDIVLSSEQSNKEAKEPDKK